MNWQLWTVVGFQILVSLVTVGNVGKERKPLDAMTAVISLIISGVLIALIVWGTTA